MRRKIADVITRMNFPPKSHDGRSLMHILNTYPHDELFQINEDELYVNALGILQLQERARVALFMRRDPFDRYVTFLIYVPRDRYDSALRARIQKFLEKAYEGKALAAKDSNSISVTSSAISSVAVARVTASGSASGSPS